MRIFLAGAAGAIGKRLVPLLLDAGHHVVGTTRSPTKADALRTAGVEPVVVDVFVAAALATGVPRLVAQSIAWMYVPGPEPHGEDDPLDVHASGTRALTAEGVA